MGMGGKKEEEVKEVNEEPLFLYVNSWALRIFCCTKKCEIMTEPWTEIDCGSDTVSCLCKCKCKCKCKITEMK